MEIFISADSGQFTDDEYEDVTQCLEMLLNIRSGEQPLERELGIDLTDILDAPTEVAKNLLTLEITQKVTEYEPRVKITSIEYEEPEYGSIKAFVHFKKAEEHV